MKKKDIEKVMLIKPSNIMPSDSVRRLSTPIGLLYLAAVLRENNYDVNILDSTCEGYYKTNKFNEDYLLYGLSDEEIVKRVREYAPDIVGVTSMFSAQQKNAIHYCDLVKSVNKEIPVILGGIHPSLMPHDTIKNNSVDYVIIGEGEYRLINLLKSIKQGKAPAFDGIAFKNNGNISFNPMTTRIEDLDLLPLPARDLIDFERYVEIGVPYGPFPRRDRTEGIMTSRGCPFNCNFCATVQYWGRSFRMRSVENMIKEIDELVNKYKIQEIQFYDDNMTVNKKRAMELFERLKDYKISWCTPHGVMINLIDEKMIKLMAESGAYQLSFGIESGSRRVLERIIQKKLPEKNKVKEVVKMCHENGIQVHGMFIVGFPGERREEMFETFQYPFDTDFDSVSFFIASPLPGSRLFYECRKKGYLDEKNMKYDVKHVDIIIPKDSPDYVMSREELEKLVDGKTREFNEFVRKKKPEVWDVKFRQFLKRHGDKADLILGRVV